MSFDPMPLTQVVREKPSLPTSGPANSSELRGRNDRSHPHLSTMDFLPSVEEPSDSFVADAPRHDEHSDEIVVSSKVEEPRRFEPEVNLMEFLPIVNDRGNIVGRALYMELHQGNKMLHPVVHLHVINGKGETTRLYWWHVAFGDTPEQTLKRKMAETLGLSGTKPLLKRHYVREAKNEKELVYVFSIVSDDDLPASPEGKDYWDLFAKD